MPMIKSTKPYSIGLKGSNGLKGFKWIQKISCQWCVDQRKGVIICQRTDLRNFSSIFSDKPILSNGE